MEVSVEKELPAKTKAAEKTSGLKTTEVLRTGQTLFGLMTIYTVVWLLANTGVSVYTVKLGAACFILGCLVLLNSGNSIKE